MADSEITAAVDKEKSTRNIDSNAETRSGNSPTTGVPGPSCRENWPTMKKLVDPEGPFIPKWNVIFIISCVFAVLLDPLFLYIPIINEDMKCLRLDNNLKIAALLLRSMTDICYLLNIFLEVYSYMNCSALRSGSCSNIAANILSSIAKVTRHSYILIDILAVLPLPQVVILNYFCKMKGSGSFGTRKLMNFLVLVQYVPRVFRIYLSCQDSKKSSKEETPIWLKGLLNFFLYILASHVLGAFWYFFAVQRVTTCWQYGCRIENGCDPNNLDCHDHHTLRNIAFLNDACSIHPPNEKFFDFGIYLNILQLGILGSTNYPEKLSNCFWWGLRNLSSLGSNLQPSISTWENLFAASISVIGLLLFIYLIGNLQTYMQLETSRTETRRWKKRIDQKMEKKSEELELWLFKNGIPLRKKSEIMVKVQAKLEENRDVDIKNILSILPLALQKEMKSCMPLSRLDVALPPDVDDEAWRAISGHLKPKKYNKDDIIIREDKPLEMMIFIVDGSVIIEMEGWSGTLERGAGQLYGEKLLTWPAWTSSPGISNESVRAITDVEVLVLTASDMKTVGSEFKSHFGKKITPLREADWELLTSDLVKFLRNVPIFRSLDSLVLKEICRRLKRSEYSNDIYIIQETDPLDKMFFLVDGTHGSSLIVETTRPSKREPLGMRELYGEELVHWVINWSSDTTFPANVPLSTSSVKVSANTCVEVHELTVHDLKNIVSKFMTQFMQLLMKQPKPPMDITDKRTTFELLITLLKQVPNLQNMEEEVLKAICKEFKQTKYNDKSRDIITSGENKFDKMFLIVSGLVCIKKIVCDDHFYCYSGQHYGDHELFEWVSCTSLTDYKLPKSDVTVQAVGDVEALVLMADDLVTVASKFGSHFGKEMAQTDPDRKHSPKKSTRTPLELESEEFEKKLRRSKENPQSDSEAQNVEDEEESYSKVPRRKKQSQSESRANKKKPSVLGQILMAAADLDCEKGNLDFLDEHENCTDIESEMAQEQEPEWNSNKHREQLISSKVTRNRGRRKAPFMRQVLNVASALDLDEICTNVESEMVQEEQEPEWNSNKHREQLISSRVTRNHGRRKALFMRQVLNEASALDLDENCTNVESEMVQEEQEPEWNSNKHREQLISSRVTRNHGRRKALFMRQVLNEASALDLDENCTNVESEMVQEEQEPEWNSNKHREQLISSRVTRNHGRRKAPFMRQVLNEASALDLDENCTNVESEMVQEEQEPE